MLYLPYAALLASLASAATTPAIESNEHLRLDFSVLRGDSRSAATKGAHAAFVSKGNYTDLQLTNAFSYYSSTLKVGSKGDKNTVLVDTGSSDLWVMSSNVACYSQPNSKRSIEDFSPWAHHRVFEIDPEHTPTQQLEKRATPVSQTASRINAATCTSLGSFNTGASSSYHGNSSAPAFRIVYGDGNYAKGTWGTDSVSVGALNVSQCNIAVVNDTTSEFGVFGIGLAGLEVTYAYANSKTAYKYQNFPLRLKSAGVINKVAYSLYLNDYTSSSGSVLFGAVDHAKYTGQLQTVPLVNVQPKYFKNPISFDVAVDSISLEGPSQQITVDTAPFAALLDSGTTLTYLPEAIVDSLASSLKAKYSKKTGAYEVSCKYNTSSASLVYNLSGAQIRVPLSDLIMSSVVLGEKTSKCYLGLVPSENSDPDTFPEAILGDNFLRHAYIVYNLEDYEISLAQVKYTNSSNIELISGSVPSAVKASGYSSTSLASSVFPQPTGSTLSTSGLKTSEGSSAFRFAKSVIAAVAGVSLLFAL